MLSDCDRLRIIELGRRYGARRILLFGSAAESDAETRDIDLGVEGIPASRFFAFYGDLLLSLTQQVDVVDLGKESGFTDMVRKEGVPLYG